MLNIRVLIVVLTGMQINEARSDYQLTLESGVVWQLRNDLQRPQNSSASMLALDEIDSGPQLFYRIEAYIRPAKNHGIRLLYAPLEIEVSNVSNQAIRYNDVQFAAGQSTDYRYKFNSYRATYFYAFLGHGERQFNLGLTAKIRDAETEVRQGSLSSSYDNVGFVPLLYLEYQTPIASKWLFHFSFDGLAGGPGRAFDFAFKVRRKIGERGMVGVGTRTLEGGVDNDKVYNFTWLQYAVVDFSILF